MCPVYLFFLQPLPLVSPVLFLVTLVLSCQSCISLVSSPHLFPLLLLLLLMLTASVRFNHETTTGEWRVCAATAAVATRCCFCFLLLSFSVTLFPFSSSSLFFMSMHTSCLPQSATACSHSLQPVCCADRRSASGSVSRISGE